MDDKPYLTNAVYRKISQQLNSYEQQKSANEQAVLSLQAGLRNSRDGAGLARAALKAEQQQNLQVAQQNIKVLRQNIAIATQQLNEIVQAGTQVQGDKVGEAESSLKTAESELHKTQSRLQWVKSRLDALQ